MNLSLLPGQVLESAPLKPGDHRESWNGGLVSLGPNDFPLGT